MFQLLSWKQTLRARLQLKVLIIRSGKQSAITSKQLANRKIFFFPIFDLKILGHIGERTVI